MAKAISLNKTGKVRGTTPKVAKADKPKPKKGRAAKRALYENRLTKGYFEGAMKMNSQEVK
ncbi:small subunit ribosomal protein S30e [Nematocida homosporus]|uniref:small subunit ribosomal protein S30e n=1 Tax=Nematocida homosporus TaxID=1912981 RepID=UPI00221F4871|nr:small subunit ribosomal protein S30e [Nematocida homosporus]KAI5185942.1 small subunit ribosomal protein S30e [Nematocida homosporus]